MEVDDNAVCEREGVSLSLSLSRLTKSLRSFLSLRKEEAYAPSGSQSIVLPILDIYEMNRVRAAIDVVWVMASLAVPQDTLRPPPREYVVDGEMSICISNPIATHRDHQGTAVQVPIPPILDPKGIVANWVERSNRVVTEDNIVDYYQVTEHGKMYVCTLLDNALLTNTPSGRASTRWRIAQALSYAGGRLFGYKSDLELFPLVISGFLRWS